MALATIPFLLLSLSACKKEAPETSATATQETATETTAEKPAEGGATETAEAKPQFDPKLVKKGKSAYRIHCTQCHNRKDPTRPGPTGPEIDGSSLELLEARVLRLEYPPGYVPKRKSKQMLKQPHLKSKLPAIHAYLNSL